MGTEFSSDLKYHFSGVNNRHIPSPFNVFVSNNCTLTKVIINLNFELAKMSTHLLTMVAYRPGGWTGGFNCNYIWQEPGWRSRDHVTAPESKVQCTLPSHR